MNKHLNNWLDKVEDLKVGTTNANIEKERKSQGYVDAPEYNKTYALTGKKGDKCILNGNTWAESLIDNN